MYISFVLTTKLSEYHISLLMLPCALRMLNVHCSVLHTLLCYCTKAAPLPLSHSLAAVMGEAAVVAVALLQSVTSP